MTQTRAEPATGEGPAPRVIGLDLSLASTGVASSRGWTETILTVGHRGDTLDRQLDRQTMILSACHTFTAGADLVVIETPAYSKGADPGAHARAGLWWRLVAGLQSRGRPILEVSPGTLKIYATGKGNAPKDTVLGAVIRRYPDVNIANNNEADAYVLAAIGARLLGHPLEPRTASTPGATPEPWLPATHLRALGKLTPPPGLEP